jgi:DNA polymerase (family 10)
VAELLRELAELTTLDEASPQAFRVRAYENARRAVEGLTEDIDAFSEAQLVKVEGIGKSTAKKIREYLDHGRIDKLEQLRAKFPPGVVALSNVPGIGPKAVLKLRKELGIENIADLRQAIADEKIRTLAGFGDKSEAKMARAIERLGLDGKEQRTPIAKALPLARRLLATLRDLPDVIEADYCGSLRRVSETIGDLDIVVASRSAEPIMRALVELPMVDQVLVQGDTKTSVLTRYGMQIDVRVVEPEQLGAARLYFTGSKAHNIKLRQLAIERGWILNEYALSNAKTGEVIARETEEQIYQALGLPWIPPPLREDGGEIEAALDGSLPRAMKPTDILGDLHVHTSLSGDGRSPLEAMVQAALARGYRYLAITEHAADLPMQGVSREALVAQRAELVGLRHKYPDIELLHGIELNIDADGDLDYDLAFRMQFDWCLASIHTHFDLSRERQTQRMLRAMADPSVNMIGHPFARTIGKRPGVELDVDAIFDAAERTGCALEINSGLSRLDLPANVLKRAREREGIRFVITSDAHHVDEYVRTEMGVQHALRGWVDPSRVANTLGREPFVRWVKERRSAVG